MGRVVDVRYGSAVVKHKLSGYVQPLFKRFYRRVFEHQLFYIVHQHLLYQIGQIRVVVVKGVTRDAAVVCDVFDSDTVDRLAVEQLCKAVLYSFVCEL